MVESGFDSTVELKDSITDNNDNNDETASTDSHPSIASSQESIKLLKHERETRSELNPNQRVRSVPVSRESLEENDSVIITREATEDTMSSSPSSYTSSRNIPITNNVHNNNNSSFIAIERRPSPVVSKCMKTSSDSNQLQEDKENGIIQHENEKDEISMTQITNIVNLPIDILIKMVTSLLEKIIQSNDTLGGSHSQNEPLEKPQNGNAENEDEDEDDEDEYYRSCYNAALSFRGKHVPQINLEEYFHRIQKYCPITNDVYLSLLIYFDRISKKCNSIRRESGSEPIVNDRSIENATSTNTNTSTTNNNSQIFVMDSFNIHRLIITAVAVSTKFSSDFFYTNSRYSKVGGISLREMNYLELQFLILCDFNLLISVDEFERYSTLLYRFWDSLIE